MLRNILTALVCVAGISSTSYARRGDFDELFPDAKEQVIPPCEGTPFCDRHRTFEKAKLAGEGDDIYYSVFKDTMEFDNTNGILHVQMQLGYDCIGDTSHLAKNLDMKLYFYQNGIVRGLIQEPNVKRFRISQQDLPVVDE